MNGNKRHSGRHYEEVDRMWGLNPKGWWLNLISVGIVVLTQLVFGPTGLPGTIFAIVLASFFAFVAGALYNISRVHS